MEPTEVIPRSTRYARENPEKHREWARAYYHRNKEKCREKAKRWRAENPDKAARLDRAQTLRKYGLTPTTFAELLEKQHGACAICLTSFESTPHVDHDHRTGAVRGLLCDGCNTGIGKLRDCPSVLRRAADYLSRGRT